jgi:PAS domain S-box-containing protein
MSDLTFRPQDLGIGRLFERVRDAVIVADAHTGRIVLWNPAATEIFGYSVSEALEMNVEELVPERLREQHRAGLARYRETGHGPYIDSHELLELPAMRKTGEEIRIEMSLNPIEPVHDLDSEGRFALAIIRDITERKRAEEEVRRLNQELDERVKERTARLEATLAELGASEERYRLLVESVEDYAIFMVDPNGRIADWNTGAERLFGYQEEEIVGEQSSLLFTPEDRRRGVPEEELRKAAAEGRAEHERWHVRKDGTRFWASGVMTPIRDETGNLRGFAKVARDITKRKEAERRLREAEMRYRTLVEQIPAITYVQEPLESSNPKAVTYMSPQYKTILGYPSESEVIDEEHWLRTLHPEDRERVLAEEARTDESGEPFKVEYRVIAGDGRVVWVRDEATLVRDEEGKPLYWLGVQYDITEQKRVEEALRQVREAERRRIARDLHDGVLQDLSYTTAAMGLIMLEAEGTSLKGELQKAIDALRRAAQGLRSVVEDLRLEEERNRPFPELVESLVERNQTMARGYEISLEVEEGFPATPLGEAGTEVLRIIQEALSNARRHSQAGNVWVSLGVEGDELVAEVSDDGRGFGPGTPSSGVGLKSMRERAAAIGGELEIESEVGQGTRVRVRVPGPQGG